MTQSRLWLVIPAAGAGRRMQSSLPKQYLLIQNQCVLDITVDRLMSTGFFAGCMVATSPEDELWRESQSSSYPGVFRCDGGTERVDSVMAALIALEDRATLEDWVLVHDAARPCVHPDDVQKLIETVLASGTGGLLATPLADTLKRSAEGGAPRSEETVDRSRLWRALTPQMFRLGELKKALDDAASVRDLITDDASAMERAGMQPRLVEGRTDNIKITVPADLGLAEFILERQGWCFDKNREAER